MVIPEARIEYVVRRVEIALRGTRRGDNGEPVKCTGSYRRAMAALQACWLEDEREDLSPDDLDDIALAALESVGWENPRLTSRTINLLDELGVFTVGDLVRFKADAVLQIRNCGNGTKQEIEALQYAVTKARQRDGRTI